MLTNEKRRELYRTRKGDWEKNACREAKKRAKRQALPFNLKPEDIIVPEFCPVLGIKLEINSKPLSDTSPTVDRIIPSNGYIKENIKVISWRANRIKNNETNPEVFELVADYLRRMAE